MKLNYKKVIFFILCCLNFYSVIFEKYKILGYIFYYLIPIIFCILNFNIIKRLINSILNSSIKYYILSLFLVGIFSFFIPVIYGTNDFSYFTIRFLQVCKEMVKMLFLLVFFLKYISSENDYKLFFQYYILATCTYVLFTVFTILFPNLREIIINNLTVDENTNRLFNQANYFTRFGWSGFSGFTFTAKATLSVIFSLYIILIEQEKNIIRNTIFLCISFLGNLFYGRIGLMVSGLCILITIIYMHKLNKKLSKRIFYFLFIGFLFLLCIAIFSPKVRLWFEWSFQNFIVFFKTGSFSTSSTSALKDMYILPSIKTFIVGDGYYTCETGYYMGIDVGLLRPIYFGGVFLQTLRYFSVGICLLEILKSKIFHKKYLSIMIMMLFIIFELKGEIVFPIINILLVIVLLIIQNKNTLEENE